MNNIKNNVKSILEFFKRKKNNKIMPLENE